MLCAAEVTARHLPSPWSVDDLSACFVVKDGSGQEGSAYVYYQEHAGRRAVAKLLTRDEALAGRTGYRQDSAIAATITRLGSRTAVVLSDDVPAAIVKPVARFRSQPAVRRGRV